VKKAFTLIELMLVVVIIGVLASLVVPRLAGRADKARAMAAKADIEANIPSAVDMFEMDTGKYPASLDELLHSPSGAADWHGPYLKKPALDPWSRPYQYKAPGEHDNDYDLWSQGKDGVSGNEDDVKNWQ
jgi:general secretion pathway protein G